MHCLLGRPLKVCLADLVILFPCPLPAAPLPISPALISVSTPQLSYLRWSLAASLYWWRAQCLLLQPLLQWSLYSSWLGHCLLVAWQGWLPPRRGNGMSLVTIDRRESSGTKFETYANFGCFVESGPEEASLKSRNQELLHHNLLPCNYLLSCVCLLFPTHYFDNSIVNQIHPVA